MVPDTPPLIWRLILSLLACPEAVPSALKLRSAPGVVGVAFDALGAAVLELDLTGPLPGAEQRIERTGGSPAARPRDKRKAQG